MWPIANLHLYKTCTLCCLYPTSTVDTLPQSSAYRLRLSRAKCLCVECTNLSAIPHHRTARHRHGIALARHGTARHGMARRGVAPHGTPARTFARTHPRVCVYCADIVDSLYLEAVYGAAIEHHRATTNMSVHMPAYTHEQPRHRIAIPHHSRASHGTSACAPLIRLTASTWRLCTGNPHVQRSSTTARLSTFGRLGGKLATARDRNDHQKKTN